MIFLSLFSLIVFLILSVIFFFCVYFFLLEGVVVGMFYCYVDVSFFFSFWCYIVDVEVQIFVYSGLECEWFDYFGWIVFFCCFDVFFGYVEYFFQKGFMES